MEIYYYTGKIRMRSGSTECSATYANASISVSPEYVTHRNIIFNEINILKGYRLSVELEMVFTRNDNDNIDKLNFILNSLSVESNGILGLNSNIFIDLVEKYLNKNIVSLKVNKLDSSITFTDYISNNMNLGQIFKIKLSSGNLMERIPLWLSADRIVNTVLADVDDTVAIDY